MVHFLDTTTEIDFRRFVNTDLAYKYDMYIEVKEDLIVTGLTGSDIVVECLKVMFFIDNAKIQWVEDRIAEDIHKYCYEHDFYLNKQPVIERDIFYGKIRYSLIYTKGE